MNGNEHHHEGSEYALGIYLEIQSGETLRLVFDDLFRNRNGEERSWRKRSFFTHIDLPEEQAGGHQLDEHQYRVIGEAVMARLIALLELAGSR